MGGEVGEVGFYYLRADSDAFCFDCRRHAAYTGEVNSVFFISLSLQTFQSIAGAILSHLKSTLQTGSTHTIHTSQQGFSLPFCLFFALITY